MNNSSQANTMSYSTALTQQHYPSRNQANVLNTITNTKLQDYLNEIGPLVEPKNITHVSKISNNRLCIFLSSKEVVDNFINNYGHINVNNETIQVRRLITPSERLVLSNVSPVIPNDLLTAKLETLELKLLSHMNPLRISSDNPQYSHILSFRRQIYIAPLDNIIIPEYFDLEYDTLNFRIILSRDNQNCFKCRNPGHLSSQCPNISIPTSAPSTSSIQQRLPYNSSQTGHSFPNISSNNDSYQNSLKSRNKYTQIKGTCF